MSSAVNIFVHAIHLKKCLAQKVGNLGSLGLIPMIQLPFNSTCVALQYEPGTKFFYQAVPELHALEYSAKKSFSIRDSWYKGLIFHS